MKNHPASETINAILRQLLFSPKGSLEGLLLEARGKTLQVSMEAGVVDAGALQRAVGQHIELDAGADHSPKTKHRAHPVYTLKALRKIDGEPVGKGLAAKDPAPTTGVVASIHYARHGEPNGVVLESGEFVHLRPHGMKQLGLRIGSPVTARGKRRSTVLGTPLIEASEVNQQPIE